MYLYYYTYAPVDTRPFDRYDGNFRDILHFADNEIMTTIRFGARWVVFWLFRTRFEPVVSTRWHSYRRRKYRFYRGARLRFNASGTPCEVYGGFDEVAAQFRDPSVVDRLSIEFSLAGTPFTVPAAKPGSGSSFEA